MARQATVGGRGAGAWALAALLGVLWLFWAAVVAAVFATFVLVAWDDRPRDAAPAPSAEPTAAVVPARPSGVPASAAFVSGALALGPSLRGATAERLLFHIGCDDGLLAVVTTHEVVYAVTSCARAPSRAQIDRMLGEPLHIEVAGGTVVLESAGDDRFELDATGVWLD